MNPFEMVKEFHQTYGVPIDVEITEELADLRMKLIQEEAWEVENEFEPAWGWGEDINGWIENLPFNLYLIDKKKLTKELADLIYVTIGTAVTFGLPLQEVLQRVHESNMSKLGEDGKPIYREDGKVLKGPNYKEAQLDDLFSTE